MSAEIHYHELVGTPIGDVKAAAAHSRSQALALLKTNRAVTSAADNGAINIFKLGKRKYHAQLHRRLVVIESVTGTKTVLSAWLKDAWRQMEGGE